MEKVSDLIGYMFFVWLFATLKLVVEQCLEYKSIDATALLIELKLSDKTLIFPLKALVLSPFLPVPAFQI